MLFTLLTKLTVGGPGTIGYSLDTLTAVGIFVVLDILALFVLFSNCSAKEKLTAIGTPFAIIFVGIVYSLVYKINK